MSLLSVRRGGGRQGQTLVEAALVLPLFIAVITGVIVFGIGLFYQQQVTNAAREGARYAALHSATADCPTSSRKTANPAFVTEPVLSVLTACDPAATKWPKMHAHARDLAGFGFDESALHFAACWSGYTDLALEAAGQPAWDAPPFGADGPDPDLDPDPNRFDQCTIGGIDPIANTSALACPPPATTTTDDKASNLAVSSGATANSVTVYACYKWSPPLAGFLLIPQEITLRAHISESLQHQR
jgi:hypothetical protein